MPRTKAQEWAQKRNLEKYRLRVTLAQLKNMITLTRTEAMETRRAIVHVESLLSFWDETNVISKRLWLEEGGK
jgi:Tfp pilus assembly protein FimT